MSPLVRLWYFVFEELNFSELIVDIRGLCTTCVIVIDWCFVLDDTFTITLNIFIKKCLNKTRIKHSTTFKRYVYCLYNTDKRLQVTILVFLKHWVLIINKLRHIYMLKVCLKWFNLKSLANCDSASHPWVYRHFQDVAAILWLPHLLEKEGTDNNRELTAFE